MHYHLSLIDISSTALPTYLLTVTFHKNEMQNFVLIINSQYIWFVLKILIK